MFKNGGGTVLIPFGQFLTGTLFLRSNINLYLSNGAVMIGSKELQHYDINHAYLIYGDSISNTSITGSGTINGNGQFFGTVISKLWPGLNHGFFQSV
ncbi:MAG: hypothetical protein HC906_08520 [Bacteroidales bacterium]|nr:hypothetical protein [Bacteroidales bacterium]